MMTEKEWNENWLALQAKAWQSWHIIEQIQVKLNEKNENPMLIAYEAFKAGFNMGGHAHGALLERVGFEQVKEWSKKRDAKKPD